jgi:hypothetical protein
MNLIASYSQDSLKPIIDDQFTDNRNNWEVVNDITEKSIITGEGFYLENNVKDIWNYYKINTPLTEKDSFIFDVAFQVLELGDSDSSHFGLLWGFSDSAKFLNKFSYDVKEHVYIASTFQKDHKWVNYHTFGVVKLEGLQSLYRLVIVKNQGKHSFFINNSKNPLNRPSEILDWHGSNFGIYIEPDVTLLVKQFRVKRLEGCNGIIKNFASLIGDG